MSDTTLLNPETWLIRTHRGMTSNPVQDPRLALRVQAVPRRMSKASKVWCQISPQPLRVVRKQPQCLSKIDGRDASEETSQKTSTDSGVIVTSLSGLHPVALKQRARQVK